MNEALIDPLKKNANLTSEFGFKLSCRPVNA